jgi:hypothetical protein
MADVGQGDGRFVPARLSRFNNSTILEIWKKMMSSDPSPRSRSLSACGCFAHWWWQARPA